MNRLAKLLGLVALAPFLMAGAAGAPPTPGARLGGPTFRADIVIDPHMAAGDPDNFLGTDVTPGAKLGSIALREAKKDGLLASVEFKAVPSKIFYLGCDTTATESRFLRTTTNGGFLDDFIPEAQLQFLFRAAGVTVGPPNPGASDRPVITRILNGGGHGECFADPRQPSVIPDGGGGQPSTPGVLFVQVVIQFENPTAKK